LKASVVRAAVSALVHVGATSSPSPVPPVPAGASRSRCRGFGHRVRGSPALDCAGVRARAGGLVDLDAAVVAGGRCESATALCFQPTRPRRPPALHQRPLGALSRRVRRSIVALVRTQTPGQQRILRPFRFAAVMSVGHDCGARFDKCHAGRAGSQSVAAGRLGITSASSPAMLLRWRRRDLPPLSPADACCWGPAVGRASTRCAPSLTAPHTHLASLSASSDSARWARPCSCESLCRAASASHQPPPSDRPARRVESARPSGRNIDLFPCEMRTRVASVRSGIAPRLRARVAGGDPRHSLTAWW